MQLINPLDPANAAPEIAATFTAIKSELGTVPNLFKVMAVEPSVLNAYMAFSSAAGKGPLPNKVREQLALTTAGSNGCDYCASAHQALGKMAGLSSNDVSLALEGRADDAKVEAALTFAKSVLADRGHVPDASLEAVRKAGWSDREILDMVANVVLNIFTNYLNNVAGTEIDFPRVATRNTP